MKKLYGILRKFGSYFFGRILAMLKYIIDSRIILCSFVFLVSVSIFMSFHDSVNIRTVGYAIASGFLFVFLKSRRVVFVIFSVVVIISATRVAAAKDLDKAILDNSKQIEGNNIAIRGYILSEPEMSHQSQRFTFRVESIIGMDKSLSVDVLVTTDKYPKYFIGQQCEITGDIMPPKSSSDFDYAGYLLNRQISLVSYLPKVICKDLAFRSGNAIQNSVLGFKNMLIAQVDSSLTEPQSGLLVGILFGQKRTFDPLFEENVRNAGVAHVVAASGYNIAFVTIGIERLLLFFKRKLRILGMIVAAWIYVLIAGFSASIVRAAIMSTFSLSAGLLGSKAFVHEAVPISASIFALLNPYILYDIGFLLSLSATLGLVYLVPVLKRFRCGSFAEPLACLLATMPITISVFGSFSIVSLAANVVISLLLDSTMIIGVIGVIVRCFLVFVGDFILLVSWVQLKVFEILVGFLGSFSFSVLSFNVVDNGKIVFVLLVAIILSCVILLFPRDANYRYSYYFSNA